MKISEITLYDPAGNVINPTEPDTKPVGIGWDQLSPSQRIALQNLDTDPLITKELWNKMDDIQRAGYVTAAMGDDNLNSIKPGEIVIKNNQVVKWKGNEFKWNEDAKAWIASKIASQPNYDPNVSPITVTQGSSLDAALMKAAGYNATGTKPKRGKIFKLPASWDFGMKQRLDPTANFGKKAGAFIGGVIGRMLDRGYGFSKGKLTSLLARIKDSKKKKEAGEDVDVPNDPDAIKLLKLANEMGKVFLKQGRDVEKEGYPWKTVVDIPDDILKSIEQENDEDTSGSGEAPDLSKATQLKFDFDKMGPEEVPSSYEAALKRWNLLKTDNHDHSENRKKDSQADLISKLEPAKSYKNNTIVYHMGGKNSGKEGQYIKAKIIKPSAEEGYVILVSRFNKLGYSKRKDELFTATGKSDPKNYKPRGRKAINPELELGDS